MKKLLKISIIILLFSCKKEVADVPTTTIVRTYSKAYGSNNSVIGSNIDLNFKITRFSTSINVFSACCNSSEKDLLLNISYERNCYFSDNGNQVVKIGKLFFQKTKPYTGFFVVDNDTIRFANIATTTKVL